MTPWPARLRALALTLLFLGAGTSLPSLDVLLFHHNGEPSQTAAHVEASDGCASHVGHCGVSCPASESGGLGVPAARSVLDAAMLSVTLRAPTRYPMPHPYGIGFHSRAPPALYA